MSNTVVFIGQQQLEAYQVSSVASKQAFAGAWNSQSLAQVFTKVAKATKAKSDLAKATSVRVVVGDNLAFISPIFVKAKSTNLKDEVLKSAQKILPEPIDALGVDWKKVGSVKDTYAIQIFAMQKSFLAVLGRAAQSADLEILSIEPVAYILARTNPDESEPHLVIWEHEAVFAAICYQGQVLASTLITALDPYQQIQALLDFVKEKYELTTEVAYLARGSRQINSDKLKEETGLSLSVQSIDLMHLGSTKPDTTGGDENVLNITPQEALPEEDFGPEPGEEAATKEPFDHAPARSAPLAPARPVAPTLPRPKPEPDEAIVPDDPDELPADRAEVSKRHEFQLNPPARSAGKSGLKGAIFLVLALLLLAGMILGGIYLYVKTTGSRPQIAPEPIASSTPEPSPTPTPAPALDRSQLKLQILNGSGVAGRAGQAATLLEDAGYAKADTANADNFDFDTTKLSVKSGQDALLDLLTKDLEGDYTIGDTATDLPEDSDFDAVITIGKQLVSPPTSPAPATDN